MNKFPNSPNKNQIILIKNKHYKYNGKAWQRINIEIKKDNILKQILNKLRIILKLKK